MSDQDTFAAATEDSNVDANQASGDESNDVDQSSKDDCGGDDGALMTVAVGKHIDRKKKRKKARPSMRTIDEENPSEFDYLHEEEMMDTMQDYSEEIGNENENSNGNSGFGMAYSGDTAMLDSNPRGGNVHHHYSDENGYGGDNNRAASQTTSGRSKGFFGHASPMGDDAAPSWFGAVKGAASKTTTPTANENTSDDEGRQHGGAALEEGGQQESEDEQAESSASAQLIREVSSNLEDRLDSTRVLAERLLQEISVYVQSLENVAREYDRIREFEVRESQRLDAVEPEVNGASGLLLGSAGESGEFFGTGEAAIQQQEQQVPPEHRYRQHSPPEVETRPSRTRRDCPLTVISNRKRSNIRRGGKENSRNRRVSFA